MESLRRDDSGFSTNAALEVRSVGRAVGPVDCEYPAPSDAVDNCVAHRSPSPNGPIIVSESDWCGDDDAQPIIDGFLVERVFLLRGKLKFAWQRPAKPSQAKRDVGVNSLA